jgi:hypothetical protein
VGPVQERREQQNVRRNINLVTEREIILKPLNIEEHFNSFILLKIYDQLEYAEALRDGTLYMRSQKVFAELDDKARGDYIEDKKFVVRPGIEMITEMRYIEVDGKPAFEFTKRKREEGDSDGVYFYANNKKASQNMIYSLYALWFNYETGEVRKIDRKLIDELGDFCCVIYNPLEFINRIRLSMEDNVKVGFVDYVDFNINPIQRRHPFMKDLIEYGNQSEYRVLFENNEVSEELFYDVVGDFKDITYITRTSDFIERFRVIDGRLEIPKI